MGDRKSTRLNSSHVETSYAVFCLKKKKEQATRCELRCPDPSCNPYLTFAAMLHAGLDGIEQGYECPEPMERNLYELTHDDRVARGIDQLPETLGEAIEELASSELVSSSIAAPRGSGS